MPVNDMPLISIIIPVYNVVPYLKRCIDSVLHQTYRHIEIILVDDGSTDYSGEICEEYAKKDPRIIVIHKANGGLSDARNVGIVKASGDYIAFIDSDDYVCGRYIERLLHRLLKNNADIVICDYFRGVEERFPVNTKQHGETQIFNSKDILKQWHGKYKHIETMAWNKLYRKALFTENNIFFPVGCLFEDVYITHLLIDKAEKIVIMNEKLYYYFQRQGSTMHTVSEKKMRESICAQNRRLAFFENNGYWEAYERLVIQRQKQYMLDYYIAVSYGMQQLRDEMLSSFKNTYFVLCKYKTLKIWEQLLFFVFRYFYCVVNVLAQIKKRTRTFKNIKI